MPVLLAALAAIIVPAAIIGVAIWRLRVVCRPGELWVFHGVGKDTPILHRAGEARLRLPFIEVAERMSTTPVPFDTTVDGVYTRGNAPVTLRLVGKVRVSTISEQQMRSAVERFLGRAPTEMAAAASQTLEGVVRELAPRHTTEDFSDVARISKLILQHGRDDMCKLGLAPTDLTVERADRNG